LVPEVALAAVEVPLPAAPAMAVPLSRSTQPTIFTSPGVAVELAFAFGPLD
jgi:hypothetical protein